MAQLPADELKPRHDFSQTVTILVGTFQTPFHLHATKLVQRSKYFEARLSGRWSNDGRPFPFPEFHPDTFHDYATWVYDGDVELNMLDESSKELCPFVSLYQLADYLCDQALCNLVTDKLIDSARQKGQRPGLSTIISAFGSSTGRDDSPLCRLILDHYLSGTDRAWLEGNIATLPITFTQQLLLGWAEASSNPNVVYKSLLETSKCKYHEHDAQNLRSSACLEADDIDEVFGITLGRAKPTIKLSNKRKRPGGSSTTRSGREFLSS